MRAIWNRVLCAVGLIGLLLTLLAHIASLMNIDVREYLGEAWVGLLFLFVFLPLTSGMTRREWSIDIRNVLTRLEIAVVVILMMYAIANFLRFAVVYNGAGPKIESGQAGLFSHGVLVRTITATEYHAARAEELLMFSSYLLLFYALGVMVSWRAVHR